MSTRAGWTAALLGLAAVALLGHTLLTSEGFPRRQKIQAELEALEANNARAEARVEKLRTQVSAHKQRAEVRARAVRDELNYVEPRDVVVDFQDTED